MERRKFIIGAGALGAGLSTAIGTGAFTSVEAERSFSVATAGDAEAYLRMTAADSPNAQYVDEQSDTLSVTLDSLNENAVTTVDDLFLLQNEGTQAISVYLTDSSDAVTFEADGSSVEGVDGAVRLGVGESVTVDVEVDTTDASGSLLDSVTVMAKSQVFAAGDDGVVTVGPSGSGVDHNTIQAGVDAAAQQAASAVLVETGTYEEQVTVDYDGLTVRAAQNGSPVVSSPDSATQTVEIAGDDITSEGLTIENEVGDHGIFLADDVSGVSIVENTIQNVGTGDGASGNQQGLAGDGGQEGISIVGNEFTSISSSIGENGYTAKAIWLSANPNSNVNPIQDVTIRGNSITDVTSEVAAYGIQLQSDISNVEIDGNIIEGVAGDPDNDVNDRSDWAAAVNLSKGSQAAGPRDISIVDNYLDAISATADDPYPGTSVVVEGEAEARSIDVNRNDIEALGGIVNKTSYGVVDATNNWWGAPTGPSGFKENETATSVDSAGSATANGDGVRVLDWNNDGTAEVNFDNFATEPFYSETHTVAADSSADFQSLTAALDAAQPTDTISIVDDSEFAFDSALTLTTSGLTLEAGDDASPTIDLTGGGTIELKAPVTVRGLSIVGEYSGDGGGGEQGNLGISVQSGASGSTIVGNEITGFYGGIQTLSNTSNVTISENTVSDTAFAIATQGGNDRIEANTVSSDIQSIATYKADGVTIVDNTLEVDSTGLTDAQTFGGNGPARGLDLQGANLTVSGNDVTAVADRDVVFFIAGDATNTEAELTANNEYSGSPVFVDASN